MNPIDERAFRFMLSGPFTSMTFAIQVGVSNPTAKFDAFRRRGLSLPCELITMRNRDGNSCRVGWFSLTAEDRKKILAWLKAA